jgi:hypothetical protein
MNNLIQKLDQLKADPAGAPPEAFMQAVASRYRRRVAIRAGAGTCILLAALVAVRFIVPAPSPSTPPDRPLVVHHPQSPDAAPSRPYLARGEGLLKDPAPVAGHGDDRILLAHGYRNPDLEHWVRN